jgi:hypothetical protein
VAQRTVAEKKTFSYKDALALLPEVKRITAEAYRQVEELGEDPTADAARRTRLDEIITEWARELIGRGLEVKGLWLVDFDNGSGYYCWRYPEEGLEYFHSYEAGFAGRMRIH